MWGGGGLNVQPGVDAIRAECCNYQQSDRYSALTPPPHIAPSPCALGLCSQLRCTAEVQTWAVLRAVEGGHEQKGLMVDRPGPPGGLLIGQLEVREAPLAHRT